jgi:predicted amidophosphoribosyltransferase
LNVLCHFAGGTKTKKSFCQDCWSPRTYRHCEQVLLEVDVNLINKLNLFYSLFLQIFSLAFFSYNPSGEKIMKTMNNSVSIAPLSAA